MPPKFQSSFIPKGSFVPAGAKSSNPIARLQGKSLSAIIVSIIFGLSVLLALGVLGYRFYLSYSIKNMEGELARARETLNRDTVNELLKTDDRLTSTAALLEAHKALSPFFTFLESTTPKSVRFYEFNFDNSNIDLEIILKGEASGYGALASAAKTIQENPNFQNPIFSDLRLDEKGNVNFSLRATLVSDFISYKKNLSILKPLNTPAQVVPTATTTQATTTSTSTKVKITN